MSSSFQQMGNIVRVNLPASFGVKEVAEFRKKLNDLIDQGQKNFIIDFKDCNFIDSTGLGILVSTLKKCLGMQGSLKLCSINSNVIEIFTLTRLDKVFAIYNNWEEANRN